MAEEAAESRYAHSGNDPPPHSGLWKRGRGGRHGAPGECTGNALRTVRTSPSVALTGRVIWPHDPAYEEARQSFNARFSRFPAAIVVCDNTNDVRNAVRWARQERIPLRARSGGHSYEAFSVVDGGLVIDVGGLNQIDVDVSRGEAVVGAGVRLLDCYRRLWDHGVTIPAGTCPGVGIAGLTLGGGIGFLSRQYGLTCDNLVAVELVDADGGRYVPARRVIPIFSGRYAAVAAGTSGSPPPSPSACTRLMTWSPAR